MQIEELVKMLLEVKQKYPTLSNEEVINLMILKATMEGNSRR